MQRVRPARPLDRDQLALLRHALWPDSPAEEHGEELTAILAGKSLGILPMAILVAQESEGTLVGFLEVGLRSHADGCSEFRPVGYVEGWYVAENHRAEGIGRELLKAAEDWARKQGCIEMASDAAIENQLSQRVHEAVGFEVVGRSVMYRRKL
jgi:aminoglycoside 6'-N-acetyltransferase I